MPALSELEEKNGKMLRLRISGDGTRQCRVPRKPGFIAYFCLVFFLIANGMFGMMIYLILSHLDGRNPDSILKFLIPAEGVCLFLLAAVIIGMIGRKAIVWDKKYIRVLRTFTQSKIAWENIRSIGIFKIYGRGNSGLDLPKARLWGETEGNALMELLETFRSENGLSSQVSTDAQIVPVILTITGKDIAGMSIVSIVLLLIDGIFYLAFRAAGFWKNNPDSLVHSVPYFLIAILAVTAAGIFIGALIYNRTQRPKAFYFDNRNKRFLISENRNDLEDHPQNLSGLSGYDYSEIRDFDVIVYKTRDDQLNSDSYKRLYTYHYVVGFHKNDGSFWRLEEFINDEKAAQFMAEDLRRTVKLAEQPQFAQAQTDLRLPDSIIRNEDGRHLIFGWRGKTTFLQTLIFLGLTAFFGWLGWVLKKNDFMPGFLFLEIFSGILLLMTIFQFASNVRKLTSAFAVRITEAGLEKGGLPIRLLAKGISSDERDKRFHKEFEWPFSSVQGIAAVYTPDTWQKKFRWIEIIGKSPENSKDANTYLEFGGLSISQTVDFEHILKEELRKRGIAVP